MALILTKIQYVRSGSNDLISGDEPFYELDGKFYLKDTHEEIIIINDQEIVFK
jgi:hypothetical protein